MADIEVNMKIRYAFFTIITLTAIAMWVQASPAAETPASPVQKALQTIDPSLAKSVTAAMMGHKAKTLFLVDVRLPSDYERCRIAGSLNIPLHAIKTKAFLKSKPIVLVNNGYAVSLLAKTCRQLNQSGFNTTILTGGLLAWISKGGQTDGDPFAPHEINYISSQLFHQEKNLNHMVVINASEKPDKQNQSLLPGAEHIPLLNIKQAGARIKKLLQKKSKNPFTTVVVYTASGKENHRIHRKLAREGFQQVFFLTGGQQEYEKYMDHLLLAGKPKKERLVSSDGCRTCVQDQ